MEAYFKSVGPKSELSKIEGIDYIYVINLDERPERYERTMNAFKPYQIYPHRFSAVNGWRLPFKAINDLGIIFDAEMEEGPLATACRWIDGEEQQSHEIMKEPGVTYYSHKLRRGAMGVVLSHLSVLQDAYDSGHEVIWVMEDDVRVISNPHILSSFVAILNKLAPDWDVLFTDDEMKAPDGTSTLCWDVPQRPLLKVKPVKYYRKRIPLTEDITQIGMRFGATSMIVHRSGMKKILDYFKKYKIFWPYDIEYFLVPDIHLYSVNKDVVTNISGGSSDTINPAYLNDKVNANGLKAAIVKGHAKITGWCPKERALYLVDKILEVRPKVYVEVGVFAGSSLFPVLSTFQFLGKGQVFAVDSWDKADCLSQFNPVEDIANYKWWAALDMDSIYHFYMKMIKQYGFESICTTLKMNSSKAASYIPEIDMLYLDGSHSEKGFLLDVELYLPKVVPGGYIWMNDALWERAKEAVTLLNRSCDVVKSFDGGNCVLFQKH